VEFTLPAGKEIVILYKTHEEENFDPDIEEHFQFDTKLNKAKYNPNNALEHLYFDENSLQHIVHFDNLRRSSIKAKQLSKLNESEDEEKKDERKDDGMLELKDSHQYLEIEQQSEDEQHHIDQNELMQSLIADDRDNVLNCEISATSCFDWFIGSRSLLNSFFLIY